MSYAALAVTTPGPKPDIFTRFLFVGKSLPPLDILSSPEPPWKAREGPGYRSPLYNLLLDEFAFVIPRFTTRPLLSMAVSQGTLITGDDARRSRPL
jgi:hypothetical protein